MRQPLPRGKQTFDAATSSSQLHHVDEHKSPNGQASGDGASGTPSPTSKDEPLRANRRQHFGSLSLSAPGTAKRPKEQKEQKDCPFFFAPRSTGWTRGGSRAGRAGRAGADGRMGQTAKWERHPAIRLEMSRLWNFIWYGTPGAFRAREGGTESADPIGGLTAHEGKVKLP